MRKYFETVNATVTDTHTQPSFIFHELAGGGGEGCNTNMHLFLYAGRHLRYTTYLPPFTHKQGS